MNAMTAAATAALAALPALILQRANPGLYDLFQNALIKAEETLRLATKSCEQMEAEIARGKNPYADLVVLSKGNDWKWQMGIAGTMRYRPGCRGDGQRDTANHGSCGMPGVRAKPVLEFTGDIVLGRYTLNMNRPVAPRDLACGLCRQAGEVWGIAGFRPGAGWWTWWGRTS